jgi:hypothetical protein
VTAYSSLPNAIRAAIAHGNTFTDINPLRWSDTYGNCGVEAVKAEWERQQWAKTTQNTYETEGK